jgi:hypothetical protein
VFHRPIETAPSIGQLPVAHRMGKQKMEFAKLRSKDIKPQTIYSGETRLRRQDWTVQAPSGALSVRRAFFERISRAVFLLAFLDEIVLSPNVDVEHAAPEV